MISALKAVVEAVKARTRITNFFTDNASLRHGVPADKTEPGDSEVTVKHEHHHEGLPTDPREANLVRPIAEPQKIPGWLKVAAAALLAGGVGTAGTYYATRPDDQPVPPVVEHPMSEPKLKSGSLLQYLEDQGEHLP